VQRTLVFITLFALAVVPATAVSTWVTWHRVAGALGSEFEQRIGRIAATAGHEVGPADLAEARLLGLTRRTLYSRMERHGLRRPGEGDETGEDEGGAPTGAGKDES